MKRSVLAFVLLCGVSLSAADADLSGVYRVVGTNPAGKSYEGTVEIQARGSVYILHWVLGHEEESYGVGIVSKDTLIVAAGPPAQNGVMLANVAVYDIKKNQPLKGKWATPKGDGLFEEVLTKLPKGHVPPAPKVEREKDYGA